VDKLKKEYNFKLSGQALAEFYDALDPVFLSDFANPGKAARLNEPLFSFAGITYNQGDFMKYIMKYPGKVRTPDVREYIDKMFAQYSSQELMNYEEAHLEEKYPEFKYIMQEYHDGILLFELMDKMVWSKAMKDTVGLQEFFNENRSNYLWEDRVHASIYTCKDKSRLKEFSRMLKMRSRKGYGDEDFLAKFNVGDEEYLQIENGIFSKGDHEVIDSIKWQKGTSDSMQKDGHPVVVIVHEVIRNQPKTLDEAKGVITSDYQNFLEEEWIKELRAKYPVTIDRDVLNTIK
jgi:peptidyl-prolyl cis-trans isomerase SurA